MLLFNVLPVTELDDVAPLRAPLESAIRNPLTQEVVQNEVDQVLAALDDARLGNSDRYYGVAIASDHTALGVMGLQTPGHVMRSYATTDNPAEVINAYSLKTARGLGVGTALLRHLETTATERGYTELVVNSGPRYMRSGWPFWNRVLGDPVAIATDYYGPHFDAPVWRKSLL